MDEIVENKLQEIKKMIIRMTYKAQVSHVGAALSVVDILYSLYFLGCVIFVFACCSMIEFLRQNLCVFVERLCRKYCNRGNCKF